MSILLHKEAATKLHQKFALAGDRTEDIGKKVGLDGNEVALIIRGLSPFPLEVYDKLNLGDEFEILKQVPYRGMYFSELDNDPLIMAFKAIAKLHERSIESSLSELIGNGVMSFNKFGFSVFRDPHPKGDFIAVEFFGEVVDYSNTNNNTSPLINNVDIISMYAYPIKDRINEEFGDVTTHLLDSFVDVSLKRESVISITFFGRTLGYKFNV